MRVLYLVGSLEAGGLERFVTRVSVRARSGQEFEPVVCCLQSRSGPFLEPLMKAGIAVLDAPVNWHRSLSRLAGLRKVIAESGSDLVHSQVNFSLVQQCLAARPSGRVFCVTERNCYPLVGGARLRRLLQFHLLRAFGTRYTANGVAVAQHLAKQVRVNVARIGVLPNGVPIIPPRPLVREAIRRELDWGANDIGVGYVSRMAAHKGHRTLLEALSLARRRGVPVKACLLGDGPERPAIQADIARLSLGDCVQLRGIVGNVDEYLEAFDIVALFSTHEGMANSLLEAMAGGKAIIASDAGANREILDFGNAGVLLSSATPEAAGAALHELAECPEKREVLGEMARLRAASVYSIDACYDKLVAHYREALSG